MTVSLGVASLNRSCGGRDLRVFRAEIDEGNSSCVGSIDREGVITFDLLLIAVQVLERATDGVTAGLRAYASAVCFERPCDTMLGVDSFSLSDPRRDFAKIRLSTLRLKKYFSCTFASSTDDKDAFTVLRHTEVSCVENLPRESVALFGQRIENDGEVASAI